jgi:hypothetical protein
MRIDCKAKGVMMCGSDGGGGRGDPGGGGGHLPESAVKTPRHASSTLRAAPAAGYQHWSTRNTSMVCDGRSYGREVQVTCVTESQPLSETCSHKLAGQFGFTG